jgi:cytochrome b6-f complex iron-sulfur subunit
MSGTSIAILVAIVLVVLAALLILGASRRRDSRKLLSRETERSDRSESPFLEEPASAAEVERAARAPRAAPGTAIEPVATTTAPVPYLPPDPETVGVTRRQFFNRSMVTLTAFSASAFGATTLAFLWPTLGAGFGAKINVGKKDDILATIRESREPLYVPNGRLYLTEYPQSGLSKAEGVYGADLPGMQEGLVALYQKCVHLGCKVPFCTTSQWFECGCHGSQYNRVGEQKGGPAPRGLDRFPLEAGDDVVVDTGILLIGPPNGTNTTGQESEGPHCITAAAEH